MAAPVSARAEPAPPETDPEPVEPAPPETDPEPVEPAPLAKLPASTRDELAARGAPATPPAEVVAPDPEPDEEPEADDEPRGPVAPAALGNPPPAPPTPADAPADEAAPKPVVGDAAAAQLLNEQPGGWSASFLAQGALGIGSFVRNRYARNPLFGWALAAAPSYRFREGTTLSLAVAVRQELTKGDAVDRPRQFFLDDVIFQVFRHLVEIPKVKIRFFGRGRIFFPTSRASIQDTLVMGFDVGPIFRRTFGPVTLSYGLFFRKNWHRYETGVFENTRGLPSVLARPDDPDFHRGFFGDGLMNVSFSLTNSVSLLWGIYKGLYTNLGWGITNSWTYPTEDDEFTASYAQPGRGRRDLMVAGVELGYAFLQNYTVALGTSTFQPPKTADNDGFRFPLFDFTSPASNLTTVYVTFGATFDFKKKPKPEREVRP